MALPAPVPEPNRLKAIFSDFDGVVLDSEPAKDRGFARFFHNCFPDDFDCAVRFHLENKHLSRYKKIELLWEQIRGERITPENLAARSIEIDTRLHDQIRVSAFIPGAHEFLEWCQGRIPVSVVSGTPRDRLLAVIHDRGLQNFFSEIVCRPPDKAALLAGMLERFGVGRDEVVYIGDHADDEEAAAEVGIPFIGVGTRPVDNGVRVDDMFGVAEVLGLSIV